MFKNRKLEIKLVKDTETPVGDTGWTKITPPDYVAIATEVGKKVLVGTVIVIGATVLFTTLSKVALHEVVIHTED